MTRSKDAPIAQTALAVFSDEELEASSVRAFGGLSLNVFYTNPAVTLARGPLYVVGLNPGGALTEQSQSRQHDLAARPRPDG